MSDHADDTDIGNVFVVAFIIANAVLWPALYGLVSGVFG
jgi:hypothetical protein